MALALDTLFVGRSHIQKSGLASTNSYAQELLADKQTAEGTLITSSYQTAGRGQIGRSWYSSPDKNILASVILKPSFLPATDQFQLSISVSLALYELVHQYLPERDVTIKWPNDIYVDDRKIAGTLIQNTLKGSTISNSIVGIGLNVNEISWPTEIPNPTSLAKEIDSELDRDSCLGVLLSKIEAYYLDLKNGNSIQQRTSYEDLLYRKNTIANYQEENGKTIAAQIAGVDEKGRLIIDKGGRLTHYQFREIRYLP